MNRRSALVKHQFIPSGRRSYGERICAACYGLEKDSVHRVPDVDEEVKEVEQRRTGERDA